METRIPIAKTLHVIRGGADLSPPAFSTVGTERWFSLSAAVTLEEVEDPRRSEL